MSGYVDLAVSRDAWAQGSLSASPRVIQKESAQCVLGINTVLGGSSTPRDCMQIFVCSVMIAIGLHVGGSF